jgi:hypothetical protein
MGVAALALALTLPACESTTEPAVTVEAIEDAAVEAIAESAGLVEDLAARGGPGAALFDRLAGEIPGFGGFYFARCDLVVVLTDRTQGPAATAILTPLLRRYIARVGRQCHEGGSVVIQPGDYTWTELSRYLPALRPLLELRGVGRMGISIPENRIVVQVRTRALVAEVKAQAEALGVPPGAIAAVVLSGGRG